MKAFLVSHSHWDREWYRTFQQFRARLVDMIDRVLDLMADDPGYRFLLDGQSIVLEDYLEIRPHRRPELERACREGRMAIGPWWVQPDSLLPSGEAHVRNLLEGRRVGEEIGPVSRVAYTPDSFGHPAQFPQIFDGFGLGPFIYWRGNGNEIGELPAEYRWEAPDGSSVLVHHLAEGYFNASALPSNPVSAADWLAQLVQALGHRTRNGAVLLMNGIDHALPDPHVAEVAEQLSHRLHGKVQRALLEDFARELSPEAPTFRGELLGAKVANLLPGVWSTRLPQKRRNRRCETLLERWAEPWAAFGRWLGGADERPALRAAWRALLQNQAHDSLCGCSQDRVHLQMESRFDTAEELAVQTTQRVLERIAGQGVERRTPSTHEPTVAVFNPSPHPRTDLVRLPLDAQAWMETRGEHERETGIHPLLALAFSGEGFFVGGSPAHLVPEPASSRVWLDLEMPPRCLEFVARDVPPFGWVRLPLRRGEPHPDRQDEGREIEGDAGQVVVEEDGTLTVILAGRRFEGLGALEDVGDRGDTYDHDPVPGEARLEWVSVRRSISPGGVSRLFVRRVLRVPAALTPSRRARSAELVPLVVDMEVRMIPGVRRIDLDLKVENPAADHRLRILFPTGSPVEEFVAATTFDLARREPGAAEARNWVHPAPATFPHQGFVSAHGLTVAAPGLPEAEVTPEGVIAITLLRSVGWLSLPSLQSRDLMAGPLVATPGAQCPEGIEATIHLLPGLDAAAARDAELGLWAVVAGDEPLVPPELGLFELEPGPVQLSAVLPGEEEGTIDLRLLNPADEPAEASLRLGFELAGAELVRLDGTPLGVEVETHHGRLHLALPPHALRTLRLRRRPEADPA